MLDRDALHRIYAAKVTDVAPTPEDHLAGLEAVAAAVRGETRSAAIADWSFRREQRDFAKLCNRLRVRRWYKRHPEKKRESLRAWRARNPELVRAAKRRHYAKRKLRFGKAKCDRCGETFQKKRQRSRFCSQKCLRQHGSALKAQQRNRGLRNRKASSIVLAAIAAHPWIGLRELTERLPEIRPDTVAHVVYRLSKKRGALIAVGTRRKLYALPGTAPKGTSR